MRFNREMRETLQPLNTKEEPVTLRNLGFMACVDHPLRVGGRFGEMLRCVACGATYRGRQFVGGSIDYVIDPIFARELRRARVRADEYCAQHGNYGPREGT